MIPSDQQHLTRKPGIRSHATRPLDGHSQRAESPSGDTSEDAHKGLMARGKDYVKRVAEDDISGLSAELAYRYFLSFVPFLMFLTALSALLAGTLDIENPAERIVDRLAPNLPSDAAGVVVDQLNRILGSPNAGILSATIVGAMLSANAATSTMLKAIARIYGVEPRPPFWRKQLMSLGLVIVGGMFILGIFVAIVASRWYVQWIVEQVGLGTISSVVMQIAAIVLVLLALIFSIGVVHRLGSDNSKTTRDVAPGAVLSAIAWVAATYLFGLYVNNFGSYNNTYGALGGIVVLLLWFYISNFVLLLGAEFNDVRTRPQAAVHRS